MERLTRARYSGMPLLTYGAHISGPKSLALYLDNKITLIALCNSDVAWVRGWDLDKSRRVVEHVYYFTVDDVQHKVEVVSVCGGSAKGRLVDDKYFFSNRSMELSIDLELFFISFRKNNVIPMAMQDSNIEWLPTEPDNYRLVSNDQTDQETIYHYHIRGYEEHQIDNLADLLSHAHKFEWSFEAGSWVAIKDELLITKRLRKPWLWHLLEKLYSRYDTIVSDQAKLINFLLQKNSDKLTNEEKKELEPFLCQRLDVQQIKNMATRQSLLNELTAAYHSDSLLTCGEDVLTDPLYSFEKKYAWIIK